MEATSCSCIADPNPKIAVSLWFELSVISYSINYFSILLNLTAIGNLSDPIYSDISGCMLKGLKHIRKLIFLDNYIMSILALAYFIFPWFFFMRLVHNMLNCLRSWIYFLDGSPKNSIPWLVSKLWFLETNILLIKGNISVIIT